MPAVTITDLNNAAVDLVKISDITDSDAATFTTRKGKTRPTWKGLADQLNAAAAITETGQNRAAAETANTQAQAAKVAAVAAGKLYGSTAAALADSGLAVGASFSAPLSDGSLQPYTKTSSSVATAIGEPFIGSPILNARLSDVTDGALPTGRNLFDKTAAVDGFAIRATDGVAVAASGFFSTPFIKVVPGGKFTVNKAIHGSVDTYGIAFYGVGKSFVSGRLGGVAAGTAIDVPATAAFVRFAVSGLPNKALLMVANGATAPPYVDHDYTDKFTQRREFAGRVAELLRDKPNLFNADTVTANTIVSSTNGAASTAAGWFATDYMPVHPGTLVFSESSTAGGGNGIAFYDSQKVFISGIAGPVVASTQYTVPDGVSFARATFQNQSGNDAPRYKLQAYQATAVPSGHREHGYADLYQATRQAQAIGLAYHDPALNIFDRTRLTQSAAALLANGTVSTNVNYATYSITDFMPVRPGTSIVCNKDVNNGTALGFVWYDRAQNYLSATTGNVTAGTSIAVPAAAFFVRATVLTNYTTEFPLFEIYNAATLPASPGFGLQDLRLYHRWAGKNLVTLGDSNTASTDGKQQWARGVAHMLKANLQANYGVSGRKMAAALSARVAGDFASTDLTTIAFGTNDYNGAGSTGGTPVGTITDAPSDNVAGSFYANGRFVIETLLTWNPGMALMLYTPFRRGNDTTPNSSGHTLKDYRDAIIALGLHYSVPVCDMYALAGFNSLNFTTFMQQPDGGLSLHPTNAAFVERVINRSARFLEEI